jgi:hypothetical protein
VKEESELSDEVVKIAGAVNDAMYLDSSSTDDIEDEVGVNNKDTITVLSKLRVSRYPPKERMMLKLSNTFIKSIYEGNCSAWTVLCDEL